MIKIICDESCEFFLPVAELAYKHLGLSGKCVCELIITDGEEIKRLNQEFRSIEKETDVLSFPMIAFDGGIEALNKRNYPLEFDAELKAVAVGSIVINDNMAKTQAKEYGHSEDREKAYLFLHGLLHLFGYDHMQDEDKRIMRAIEENILSKLGLGIIG